MWHKNEGHRRTKLNCQTLQYVWNYEWKEYDNIILLPTEQIAKL